MLKPSEVCKWLQSKLKYFPDKRLSLNSKPGRSLNRMALVLDAILKQAFLSACI